MLSLIQKFKAVFALYFTSLDPFKKESLQDIIANDMEKAIQDKEDLEHAVKIRRFHIHMTEAKISAMEQWRLLESYNARADGSRS